MLEIFLFMFLRIFKRQEVIKTQILTKINRWAGAEGLGEAGPFTNLGHPPSRSRDRTKHVSAALRAANI